MPNTRLQTKTADWAAINKVGMMQNWRNMWPRLDQNPPTQQSSNATTQKASLQYASTAK
jgi:hypothetical protein